MIFILSPFVNRMESLVFTHERRLQGRREPAPDVTTVAFRQLAPSRDRVAGEGGPGRETWLQPEKNYWKPVSISRSPCSRGQKKACRRSGGEKQWLLKKAEG